MRGRRKKAYLQRVVEVERASFTPMVFTTTGGMAPECERFNWRLVELISIKRKKEYSHVMRHIHCSLQFALLKATLLAVRGSRGRAIEQGDDFADIAFNLVPHRPAYEG